MNRIKRELFLFFYINNLPVLMIILSLVLIHLSFNFNLLWSSFFYTFIIMLFIFPPFFSVRKLPIARKLFTMIWGVFMITSLYLWDFQLVSKYVFLVYGISGSIFFIADYFKQRSYSYEIEKNGLVWCTNGKNIEKYLNSKCSRQAFLRTAWYLDNGVNKRKVTYEIIENLVKYEFGYKWYTFFPDSSRPLVGVLFPKSWRKFRTF